MSLLSWLFRKPAAAPQAVPRTRAHAPGESQAFMPPDATVPLGGGRPIPPASGPAANRKNERMERRELLYSVVRDAMVRASVLSASYKFKVLSLDQQGRQFLVMIDLAHEFGNDMARLSEQEAVIAQMAKARYDILVTAVYWRTHEHVAVGQLPKSAAASTGAAAAPAAAASSEVPAAPTASPLLPPRPAPRPAPRPSAPPLAPLAPAIDPIEAALPVIGAVSAPAPLQGLAPEGPLLGARTGARFDPIEADEVAAFKRALSQVATPGPAQAPAGVTVHSGPKVTPSRRSSSYTGFEDTEMPDDSHGSPDLSRTQYGELQ